MAGQALWLRAFLEASGAQPVAVIRKAGFQAGFSLDVLKRAKRAAGVRSVKRGFDSAWLWEVIEGSNPPAQESEERSEEGPAPLGAAAELEEPDFFGTRPAERHPPSVPQHVEPPAPPVGDFFGVEPEGWAAVDPRFFGPCSVEKCGERSEWRLTTPDGRRYFCERHGPEGRT
jgi:hypothetical protein